MSFAFFGQAFFRNLSRTFSIEKRFKMAPGPTQAKFYDRAVIHRMPRGITYGTDRAGLLVRRACAIVNGSIVLSSDDWLLRAVPVTAPLWCALTLNATDTEQSTLHKWIFIQVDFLGQARLLPIARNRGQRLTRFLHKSILDCPAPHKEIAFLPEINVFVHSSLISNNAMWSVCVVSTWLCAHTLYTPLYLLN